MNDTMLKKYIQLGLIGLCIVFAFILIFEMTRSYELDTDNLQQEQQVIGQNQNKQVNANNVLLPIDDYSEIIERPLFMEDRRPFVAEEIVAEPKTPTRQSRVTRRQEDFLLSAVIITDNKRIALLQSGRNKKLQKVSQGEEINGWTVIDIRPNLISMKKGNEEKILELTVKPSPRQKPASPTENNAQIISTNTPSTAPQAPLDGRNTSNPPSVPDTATASDEQTHDGAD